MSRWWRRITGRNPRQCESDLSGMFAGMGPLPCEAEGDHEVHERWSPPLRARWVDVEGGRLLEFAESVD